MRGRHICQVSSLDISGLLVPANGKGARGEEGDSDRKRGRELGDREGGKAK
jgi:hypothetical protein